MNSNISNLYKKKQYLGIQILRVIFSFHILVFHCTNHSEFKSKMIKAFTSNVGIDLITFFIISFYFSYNSLAERNIKKIKQRFKRLLIPYIIWPIIFFIKANFPNLKKLRNYKILYYQFLIGNGVHIVFWFQFNLIFLYLFYTIIIFFYKNRYLFFLLLNGILSYIFIITYINILFSQYNDIATFSIKPLFSSNIYSIVGLYLYSIKINKINMNYKKIIIYICIIIMSLCLFFKIYSNYYFFNIFINTFASTCLFIIFLFLSFEKKINNKYNYIIEEITNYTAGIYYLHIKIRDCLKCIIKIKSLTIIQCIINYLLCYFICFFGFKIFKNISLKYLFI